MNIFVRLGSRKVNTKLSLYTHTCKRLSGKVPSKLSIEFKKNIYVPKKPLNVNKDNVIPILEVENSNHIVIADTFGAFTKLVCCVFIPYSIYYFYQLSILKGIAFLTISLILIFLKRRVFNTSRALTHINLLGDGKQIELITDDKKILAELRYIGFGDFFNTPPIDKRRFRSGAILLMSGDIKEKFYIPPNLKFINTELLNAIIDYKTIQTGNKKLKKL